jgi:hypothetical protein
MKEQKINYDKKEECALCNRIINTSKDEWVSLIDFKGNDIMKSKFYHKNCLNDLLTGQGRVITENFKEKVNATIKNLMKGKSNCKN